jgi:hypothetical protein
VGRAGCRLVMPLLGRESREPPMTEQYLIGELSSLLGDLEPVPGPFDLALRDLRREVEASPPSRLRHLVEPAVTLTSSICWAALETGDVCRFCEDVNAVIRLRDFVFSANLLPPPPWRSPP